MARRTPPDCVTILGIETSCDETAAAVVSPDGEIRSSVVASQDELHARFGGVVPEVASRRHLELVTPVIEQALGDAGVELDDVDAVAVTARPGLIGALLVGVSAAKALAWAQRLPLIPVNHLHGHVASLYLRPLDLEPPFTCLLASGGHTMLLDVTDRGCVSACSGRRSTTPPARRSTRARGCSASATPADARSTRSRARAIPTAFDFPVARVPGLDFSFSGLKTALLYRCATWPTESWRRGAPIWRRATSGRSCGRSSSASRRAERATRIAVVGGVAANSELRAALPRRRSRRSRSAPTTPR